MSYGRADFARETGVSRETLADFDRWHDLLIKWNRRINLVSSQALDSFWQRHALDSWQLVEHVPEGDIRAMDLGSGAGFPGLALGICFKLRGQGRMKLVESAGKKANFLRTVVRELNLPVEVSSDRIEHLRPEPVHVMTARAFAPLPRLLEYGAPFWGEDTRGLFLKGQGVEEELDAASRRWDFDASLHDSRSDPSGKILVLTGLSRLKTTDRGEGESP